MCIVVLFCCLINTGLKRRLKPIIYTIPPNLPLRREACGKAAPCSPPARWVMMGIDGERLLVVMGYNGFGESLCDSTLIINRRYLIFILYLLLSLC